MVTQFYRTFFLQVITTFLLCQCVLYGEWNENFDSKKSVLIDQFDEFKYSDYGSQYSFFVKARKRLLNDHSLLKKISSTPSDIKLKYLYDKEIFLKKRRQNNTTDLNAWELSYLTGFSEAFLPSFPIDFAGTKVIIQHAEKFEFGNNREPGGYSPANLRKISLETYWKAVLQIYLIGMADMVSANIGINNTGMVRFFDMEKCFVYSNSPSRNHHSFSIGYHTQAFDWPQFYKPLDRKTARVLQDYILSLEGVENKFRIYAAIRELDYDEKNFLKRLNYLRTFTIEEGVTFKDFFDWVNPTIGAGMDELDQIVSEIFKWKVGHGTSLMYMDRWHKHYHDNLTPNQKSRIMNWLDKYLGSY